MPNLTNDQIKTIREAIIGSISREGTWFYREARLEDALSILDSLPATESEREEDIDTFDGLITENRLQNQQISALRARIEELESELRGANAFHRVAVKERDYERHKNDALTKCIEELEKEAVEYSNAIADAKKRIADLEKEVTAPLLTEIPRLADSMADSRREIDRAFAVLSMHGVSRERAETVDNGVEVYATRMTRELADLRAENERLRAALKTIRSRADKPGRADGTDAIFSFCVAEETLSETEPK